MTDVIDLLAGLSADGPLDAVRHRRSQARENAQRSFAALLEPSADRGFTLAERYAVATFVSALHDDDAAVRFYGDLLADEDDALLAAVLVAATAGRTSGPVGRYREPGLSAESIPVDAYGVPDAVSSALGDRLTAALEHAHLLVFRPRESSADALRRLVGAGWDADQIVSLSQLVSFLAFQLRAVAGLRVVSGRATQAWAGPETVAAGHPHTAPAATDLVTEHDGIRRPDAFTQDGLGWVPWLAPVEREDLTPEQIEALIEPARAAMPYFRLLARDPAALEARTLTDLDIFTNTDGGLPRAARELSAATASRLNGCVFCAFVHAAFATRESGRRDDVQRLLDDGVAAELGDEQWNAVAAASAALAVTPPALSEVHVARLRDAGLDDAAIVDAVNGAAFFSWANRLMLSLGEPEVPARR
ncbi:alkylhydroperoxidase domain protein [Microbacterium trichothecenolyticum]|uniref:Alkylhydroperoxidase domain protein/CMD domain protein n=1 Tax=Microbacterium trichothecenolyticum TaxID=69370 RepID=A0ABU0TWE3_MICTR|nr:alkylhydroperoxidase domain protein [Microbacterium trichothecenolyticum]MDQ1123983.1 alkylhydroperoxidase domain protein/CMD domain protein [Microbacterium trichothecenolyticum]